MASYDTFKKCIGFVLKEEGGETDDARDNGGKTKHGISDMRDGVADKMTDVDGDGTPDTKIAELTVKQAANIYWRDYWLKTRCDRLPDSIAAFVFDSAVNCGQRQAAKFLQRALGLNDDGKIGPITISGAELSNFAEVLDGMAAARENYYRGLNDFKTFGNGWLSRNGRCLKFSKEFL